ncbi:hypothetical protein [Rhodococcus rhodochrous]|uniref:hypothetical protein n=1 Tax=Rhodococcus rhodochrous TaxID=1829 RepID=UPI0023F67D38
MKQPQGPFEIPPSAFMALESLRVALKEMLPEQAQFGIGVKQKNGQFIDQLALIVFLPKKLPIDMVPKESLVPPTWREKETDFATDVIESNPKPIQMVDDHGHYRPLKGGIEIGWEDAHRYHRGTLGCVVQRRRDGARLLLTASHATAPEDVFELKHNTPMWQPAPNAQQSSKIGFVEKNDFLVDCAVIKPNPDAGEPITAVHEIGPIRGAAHSQLWAPVKKRGRSTGLTTGLVVAVVPDSYTYSIDTLVISEFPFGGLFAWYGDSGSVILNANDEVIGLLVAMDCEEIDGKPVSSTGRAVNIQTVLDALDIEVAVAPPAVTRVYPDTALGVLANGGRAQVEGWGFDSGTQVAFGEVVAPYTVFHSPRSLTVTPPIQFIPGTVVNITATNSAGERSAPESRAQFTY